MMDERETIDTVYGKCSRPVIVGNVIYTHPLSDRGAPFVNQWLPLRKASLLERLVWTLFGKAPRP